MATRNFAYDHPAYRVPVVFAGAAVAGANSSVRFAAFADLIAKNLVIKPAIAGTSASVATIYKVSNTTTTSLGAATIASAQTTYVNVALSDAAISKGDEIRITNGTDATGVNAHALECLVNVGADLTA